MELHGSIVENLEGAVNSARRLRGHAVYTDTVRFWNELVAYARHERSNVSAAEATQIEQLIVKLELELADLR